MISVRKKHIQYYEPDVLVSNSLKAVLPKKIKKKDTEQSECS